MWLLLQGPSIDLLTCVWGCVRIFFPHKRVYVFVNFALKKSAVWNIIYSPCVFLNLDFYVKVPIRLIAKLHSSYDFTHLVFNIIIILIIIVIIILSYIRNPDLQKYGARSARDIWHFLYFHSVLSSSLYLYMYIFFIVIILLIINYYLIIIHYSNHYYKYILNSERVYLIQSKFNSGVDSSYRTPQCVCAGSSLFYLFFLLCFPYGRPHTVFIKGLCGLLHVNVVQ